MTMGALYFNDRDVETDFSFYTSALVGWPGNLSAAPRNVPLMTAPAMSGGIIDPMFVTRTAAMATITGMVLTASPAAALAALDALREFLGAGEVAVRTYQASDRQCLAVCTGFDGIPHQAEIQNGNVNLTLPFVVASGVAQRIAPDGYALSTSRTSCPVGTAESRPIITVHGGGAALTNPTITIRNAAGDVVQTMTFTVVIGATAALRIDCARMQASIITAGVITDALAASDWSGGDFLCLRNYDGIVALASSPTVELSSTAGTAQGVISYTRQYL